MPSTTRGSILISTANDIGEALVEKLGGVGYSPNEWKEKYNLCGIAPIDSAPALSVLADSAGTGDERGSILIATADAIGAILNKKYNVLRGFKPKEWASACRKMKALEEGSVASASIASFSDGADTVPLTSCVCNIDANLDGKTAVNAVHAGVNLLSMVNYDGGVYNPDVDRVLNLTISETQFTKNGNVYSVTTSATWKTFTVLFPIVAGVTYYEKWTLSIESGQQGSTRAYLDKDFKVLAKYNNNSSDPIITNGVMTPPTGAKYLAITWTNRSTAVQTLNITEPMIELGSSASAFEPYKGETKTADLGRAVYGGSADIVNGSGTDTHGLLTDFSTIRANGTSTSGAYRYIMDVSGMDDYNVGACISNLLNYRVAWNADVGDFYNTANVLVIFLSQDNKTDAINYLSSNSCKVAYPLATPEPFTFDGQEINTRLGYNAFWSDSGNTAVDYYKAPTPYTRKTATGGIANFSDQRTDLPLTKAIANIAPSIAGKSAVNLYQGSEQYQPTTTYTAELGETVYGGNVDFVSGAKSVSFARVDMGSLTWQYDSANTRFFTVDLTSVIKRGSSGWITDLAVDPTYTVASGTANDKTISEYATTGYIYIKDTDYTDPIAFKASLSGKYLTYPLATPTESTIPGRVISPIEGVNNYWNDAGGDTEIQYFEDET